MLKLSPWQPSRTLGFSLHTFFDCWTSKNSINTSLSNDFQINSSTGYCLGVLETFHVSELLNWTPIK
ncbi:hypothetical protein ACRRTK_021643 [Alexandromys fortis]